MVVRGALILCFCCKWPSHLITSKFSKRYNMYIFRVYIIIINCRKSSVAVCAMIHNRKAFINYECRWFCGTYSSCLPDNVRWFSWCSSRNNVAKATEYSISCNTDNMQSSLYSLLLPHHMPCDIYTIQIYTCLYDVLLYNMHQTFRLLILWQW